MNPLSSSCALGPLTSMLRSVRTSLLRLAEAPVSSSLSALLPFSRGRIPQICPWWAAGLQFGPLWPPSPPKVVAKPFWSAGLPFHWAPAARPVAERSEPNGRGAPGPSRQWLHFGLAPAAGGGGFGSYAKVMAGSSRDRGIPKPPWRRGYAAKALDETGSTADPVAGRVVGRGRAPSRATRR